MKATEAASGRDRRERFVALAEARTSKAINAMRLIGNLSNRSNYEFTDSDAQQILRALEGELRVLKTKFVEGESQRDRAFRLRGE